MRYGFFNANGSGPIEVADEEQAKTMLEQWQAQNPFAPAGSAPKFTVREGAKAGQPSGRKPEKAGGEGYGMNRVAVPPHSQSVENVLRKKPSERTSAEVQLLKDRRAFEEMEMKSGKRIEGGGISRIMAAEEEAGALGRRDATAAAGYYAGMESTLAQHGRNPDGSKMQPGATPAAAGEPSASQAQPGKPVSTAAAAPSESKPQGFAMRTMPDGAVRTASGGPRSTIRDFGTREEALAFFRPIGAPPPAAAAPAAAAPAAAAQPAPAPAAAPAAPAVAAPAAPPAGQVPPPPAAAAQADKTTSPTAKLGMGGTSVPTTPSKQPLALDPKLDQFGFTRNVPRLNFSPAAPQPADAASDVSKVSSGELLAQATGARPSPGAPAVGFATAASTLWQRGTDRAIWNSRPPQGGLYGRNPVNLGTANREIVGAPSVSRGYQKAAEELDPRRTN